MPQPSPLMVKVCHYYYRDQLTMAQIGDRLSISRHRVGRLLKEALDTGVVQVEIRAPFIESARMGRALERQFGLKSALVAEVLPELTPEEVKRATCRAGAGFLRELLDPDASIGVGWGSTTFELVDQLEPLHLPQSTVVQITGGNKRLSVQFDCHEVTRRLAQKLGVDPVLLHAPGIVDKRETRELLMRESAIAETFRHYEKIGIAIVGIGSVVPEVRSMLASSGYVSGTELKSLQQAGAVGDVFSYFIDESGAVARTELYERLITIELRHIRKIPTRVGIATGVAKARAVAAAVRGGFVNTLIVDSALAEAVLAQSAPSALAKPGRKRGEARGPETTKSSAAA